MPPRRQIPAPIDRPLHKSYLREFTGWQTAYPPGLSDPTSLRVLENMMVLRDGSVAVRPGLTYISFRDGDRTPLDRPMVGSHVAFYLNDGSKAHLFAVREADDTVGFRVGVLTDNPSFNPMDVRRLDDPSVGFEIPQGEAELNFSAGTTYVKYLQTDNKIFALSNGGEAVRLFWVGEEKLAKKMVSIEVPEWGVRHQPEAIHPPNPGELWTRKPDPATPTVNTLISSDRTKNVYNFGYYYTFSNELGESAPSQVTVVRAQRRWSAWIWETSNEFSEPSGVPTTDPEKCADQLFVYVPEDAWDEAVAAGATHWNLYMLTWSNQDAIPPEGLLIGSNELKDESFGGWDLYGYIRHTPQSTRFDFTAPLPSAETRHNYSTPPKAGQGLVVGDRVVLVYDAEDPAVIRWSSNQPGDYTNFSASKGGGYKTLSSGNLYVPASVKLWQNPQSVDTIVILCLGTDGYSTAYYMAPAEVAGLTELIPIMGFEETTATPGTSSPYGVEVYNSALYHPLEDQLMKTTAANYHISHKTMTEAISNRWQQLRNRQDIVSSELDGRLYYIVTNPSGEEVPEGCLGNEIWVLDAASDTVTWSRFLIPAISLRKMELKGSLYMSVVRPEGLYILDPLRGVDNVLVPRPGQGLQVEQTAIQWRLETNTQGANRVHDAWCRLQQANVTFGNFSGMVRYGIRGKDVHGKLVEVAKNVNLPPQNFHPSDPRFQPYDYEDFLLVRKDLKEWVFFAERGPMAEDDDWTPSTGQISLVQYLYTPTSVNVGYEYGSVETFEYRRTTRDPVEHAQQTTDGGVPVPFGDRTRW